MTDHEKLRRLFVRATERYHRCCMVAGRQVGAGLWDSHGRQATLVWEASLLTDRLLVLMCAALRHRGRRSRDECRR